jgi:hypothetical protein
MAAEQAHQRKYKLGEREHKLCRLMAMVTGQRIEQVVNKAVYTHAKQMRLDERIRGYMNKGGFEVLSELQGFVNEEEEKNAHAKVEKGRFG